MRDELLNENPFSLDHAREKLAVWAADYNTGRPPPRSVTRPRRLCRAPDRNRPIRCAMWKLHGSAYCSYRAPGRNHSRDAGPNWIKNQGQVTPAEPSRGAQIGRVFAAATSRGATALAMTRPELLRSSLAWLLYPGSWSSASADDDRTLDDDDVGRAFLPAGLGTSDLTGRRDGAWTGTAAAITGLGSDRR